MSQGGKLNIKNLNYYIFYNTYCLVQTFILHYLQIIRVVNRFCKRSLNDRFLFRTKNDRFVFGKNDRF